MTSTLWVGDLLCCIAIGLQQPRQPVVVVGPLRVRLLRHWSGAGRCGRRVWLGLWLVFMLLVWLHACMLTAQHLTACCSIDVP